MKNKIFVTLALLLLWPVSAFSCEHPKDYIPIAERPTKTLLFKLTGCGAPDSYMFGTFHSDSPALLPLLQQLEPYIEQTSRLWLEIVATPESQSVSRQYLTLPATSPNLSELIGPQLYAKTKQLIGPRLGLPDAQLQRFTPWSLALLVQYPPNQSDGIVLDAKLQLLAARKAVPASSLEVLEEQYEIFTQMPPDMQRDFLASTLEDFHELEATMQQLNDLYLTHDIEAIHQLSRTLFDEMAKDYPELAQYLELHLIDKRNLRMSLNVAEHIGIAGFFAVGALHLPGEKGMLQLLEKTGLQIYPIPLNEARQ